MQKLLVLGGTNFIGRNLLEQLVGDGNYDITLFNRGETNPLLFPNLRHIKGDRNTADIAQLFEDPWDIIVDLSCFYPAPLEQLLAGLKASVKRYVLVSTCSVYDNDLDQSVARDESAPILACSETEKTDTTVATYGKRKAACERVLANSSVPHTILRPALVYGRYDASDRLYYWLHHAKLENELLLPNDGRQRFSVTYVQDLVRAIVSSIKTTGASTTYNVITEPKMSLRRLVDTACDLLETQPEMIYANSDLLNQNGIEQWTGLPLWLDCDYFTYSNQAITAELKFKPTDFRTSIAETVLYFDGLNWPEPTFGISNQTKHSVIQQVAEI